MLSEKRSGIHVRNHNFENIGVSLIGNFEEQELAGPQLDALTKILGWAANEYNIPFQRPSLVGITVDQSVGTAGWNSLGAFDFKRGDGQWLTVYDHTPFEVQDGQHIIADAIRLTPVGNTNNQTTPNTTQNTNTGSKNGSNNAMKNRTNSTNGTTGTNDGHSDSDQTRVEDGCSTTGSSSGFMFLFGVLVFLRRKKKSKQVWFFFELFSLAEIFSGNRETKGIQISSTLLMFLSETR